MQKERYQEQLNSLVKFYSESKNDFVYKHTLEMFIESTRDWSLFYTLNEVKSWFNKKRADSKMTVEDIPLNEMNGWLIDSQTGNISHESRDFFTVHGVRVRTSSRENAQDWDQPIMEQVGYDGGVLGLIRKRFDGIPHYLCEAKFEPGNYGGCQLSPTLQATFSNIKQSHGGREPFYTRVFLEENAAMEVLFDAWMAEDGGRMHLKRNRGVLVEVPESYLIELPSDDFIWLSLFQIKALMIEDAWVNPHLRGILAHA